MPLLELPLSSALAGLRPDLPSPAMIPPVLAEISGAQAIALVAIIGGLLLTGVLVVFGLKYAQRRQELWHETARLALEKGQPLPPLPGEMQDDARPDPNSDFRTGLILVATGAGLYFFFLSLFGGWMKWVGAIPGFIGVALLIYAGCDALFRPKDTSPTKPPHA